MTKMTAVTAHVDDRVAVGLDRLAARSGRNAAAVAPGRFVDEQGTFRGELDEAIVTERTRA